MSEYRRRDWSGFSWSRWRRPPVKLLISIRWSTGCRHQQVDLVRITSLRGEGEVRPRPVRLGVGQQLLDVRQCLALMREL